MVKQQQAQWSPQEMPVPASRRSPAERGERDLKTPRVLQAGVKARNCAEKRPLAAQLKVRGA